MVTINLSEALAQQLEAIARRENRLVEDVVAAMINKYEPPLVSQEEKDADFDYTDTAIMAVAERLNIAQVYTFDQRDFHIFRPQHCEYLELRP